jgi:carbon-monoxide dehydrogenase medium subunit
MIPAPLQYVRAGSLEEALEALAVPDAKALAGGQSLIPVLKLRIARPGRVVDLGRLGLDGIELRDGELRLGALVTWDMLGTADTVDALADCARVVGDLQVRNRGTIGGSLVHADPAADLPAVALALGARLVLRSATDEREVAADDFFLGPFTTAIEPAELLTEVLFPVSPPGSGSAYVKVEHPASGFALAGAAALVRPDGSRSVAVTGVGARASLLPEDGSLAGVEIYGDRFAPEEYRRHLAGVVVARALALAEERAGA